MYGYQCEYCDGIVREQMITREVFKHRSGFVMLEDVPVGICDKCGYRYYHASLLHQVEAVASKRRAAERMELIPVAHFA